MIRKISDYFTKRYFERQTKPKGFDDLEYKFIDSKGRRYFVWKEIMDIPLSRKPHLDKAQMELSRMMTGEELGQFLDKMSELSTKAVEEEIGRGKRLAQIVTLCEEVKMRNELLYHKEIYVDLIACITVREDEDPERFDVQVHTEKVDQFMDDSESGLAFFLQKSGLSKLLPFIDELGESLPTLLEREVRKMQEIGSLTSGLLSRDSETSGKDT